MTDNAIVVQNQEPDFLIVGEGEVGTDLPISIGALENETTTRGGREQTVNPYFAHVQCKKSTGDFQFYKGVPKSENPEGSIKFSTGTKKIVALEGDIVATNFGFSLSVNGFADKLEGESPFRCQTSRVELQDSDGVVVAVQHGSKPLSRQFYPYSPYQSKANPTVPNKELSKELKGGYKRVVYGTVDYAYAQRACIPRERRCEDCVMAGTHIAEDTVPNKEGNIPKQYCSMNAELVFYVRKIGFIASTLDGDDDLQFIEVGSPTVLKMCSHLDKPMITCIPLGREDVGYKVNTGKPFSLSVDFNDPVNQFVPKNAQPIGQFLDTIRTKYTTHVSTKAYFPNLGDMARPPEFFQVPVRLYLAPATANRTETITAKTVTMLGSVVEEELSKGTEYAKTAWLRYYAERQLALGNLIESEEHEVEAPTQHIEGDLAEAIKHLNQAPVAPTPDSSPVTVATTPNGTPSTTIDAVATPVNSNGNGNGNGSKQLDQGLGWSGVAKKSSRQVIS